MQRQEQQQSGYSCEEKCDLRVFSLQDELPRELLVHLLQILGSAGTEVLGPRDVGNCFEGLLVQTNVGGPAFESDRAALLRSEPNGEDTNTQIGGHRGGVARVGPGRPAAVAHQDDHPRRVGSGRNGLHRLLFGLDRRIERSAACTVRHQPTLEDQLLQIDAGIGEQRLERDVEGAPGRGAALQFEPVDRGNQIVTAAGRRLHQ